MWFTIFTYAVVLVFGWLFLPNPQWSIDLGNWIKEGAVSLVKAGWAKMFGPSKPEVP